MQWDDDWHHPDRIEKQVAALSDVPARWLDVSACFLYRQLCYSFGSDTAFVREFPDTFMHGAIIHRNLGDRRYRPLEREEDTYFLWHFPAPTVPDNDPKLYIRFAHGRNTWPEEHIMRQACSFRHHWLVNDADAMLL